MAATRPDPRLGRARRDPSCQRAWCRENRLLSDIVTAFGPPSVLFGGNNPNYPKTLAYATNRPDDGLLCFHLGNSFVPSPSPSSASVHAEPVLWAFRDGGTLLFTDGFIFTPEGSACRRAS
ncbi:hypothetical protein ACFY1B_34700 [Streptomyces mirabilis]|uniref:hypothetical protein n=1 Tax=Streptomyces mirabilis TaxID=68239 RepID=UPI0036786062